MKTPAKRGAPLPVAAACRILTDTDEWPARNTYDLLRAATFFAKLSAEAFEEIKNRADRSPASLPT